MQVFVLMPDVEDSTRDPELYGRLSVTAPEQRKGPLGVRGAGYVHFVSWSSPLTSFFYCFEGSVCIRASLGASYGFGWLEWLRQENDSEQKICQCSGRSA
jgi:hypothetical protein